MVDQSISGEDWGYYADDRIECVGGPFDGKELTAHPLMNARFWLDCEDGKRAWYQCGVLGYPHKALYLSTTE